jgi:hypothetical protein
MKRLAAPKHWMLDKLLGEFKEGEGQKCCKDDKKKTNSQAQQADVQ